MTTGDQANSPNPAGPPAAGAWRRCGQILLVLSAVVGVRVWLIHHMTLVANDAVLWYVPMARHWAKDPHEAIRSFAIHPGYPAATAAFHTLRGAPDETTQWDRSGQWVSLAAATAAMLALYLVTGLTCNWRIAWIATLLFGVARKWSTDGADALSDATALCMALWTLVTALAAARQLRRRRPWAILTAAGVGAFAAAGYLVRPEAAAVGLVAIVLWLAGPRGPRTRRWLTPACAGVMILTALLCALPYMWEIGGITRKWTRVSIHAAGDGPVLARADAMRFYEYVPLRQLVNKLFEAMHPGLGFLACGWLVVWLVSRRRRRRWLPDPLAGPGREGGVLMAASLLIVSALAVTHYARAGAMSHRYLLLPAALLSGLAGSGVIVLGHWLAAGARRLGWARCRPAWMTLLVAGGIGAGLSAHTLRPRRDDRAHHLAAARFLRDLARPGDVLLTDSVHVLRYAEVPGEYTGTGFPATAKMFLKVMIYRNVTLVALRTRVVQQEHPEVARVLHEPAFTEIGRFSSPTHSQSASPVAVYRVDPPEVLRLLGWKARPSGAN